MIIWIASYPKSGNTWVRSLLASYYYTNDGLFNFEHLKEIGLFPHKKYFRHYKDIFQNPTDTCKYWITEQEKISSLKKFNFFKTHNALLNINGYKFTNNKNTIAGIYIVRDPRNVITSVSHHYEKNIANAFKFMTDEKHFLFDEEDNKFLNFQPLSTWGKHYTSWTKNRNFPVLTIKYEELENETFSTFKRIFDFIKEISKSKMGFDRKKLKNSIISTTFENLSKMEEREGFRESLTSKDGKNKIKFFNLGKKNNWKNILNKEIVKKLETEFEEEMRELCYL